MQLYYNPMSTYSQKVLIAFHEKGITFEPRIVNLMDPADRAAFEQVYPIGKLPFLKPNADHSVPESSIIIEYLDDQHPQTPRLTAASGGAEARQVRFMDRMLDQHLNEPMITLFLTAYGFRPRDEAAIERARKHIAVTYDHLDRRLADQTWVCGESFTVADCALIPPLYYAQHLAPFDAYPSIRRYWKRAQQRPSYRKVMDEFLPMLQQIRAPGTSKA